MTAQPKAFTVSAAVVSGQTILAGFVVRETAGAAARIRIYDGTSAAGTVIGAASLAANGAETVTYVRPIRCQTGVYVEVVTGTVEGSVHIA